MKPLIDWLLGRRYRPILVAAAMSLLMPVITVAIIALETIRRGTQAVAGPAGIGALAVVAVAALFGAFTPLNAAMIVASFAVGLAVGALLRWAQGIALSFQVLLLAASLAVLVIGLAGVGGSTLLGPVFEHLLELLRERGATPEQIEAFREIEPRILGVLAGGLTTLVIASMFLAYWLRGVAARDSRFGEEFRRLRVGRMLGLPATVLVTVVLVLDAPLIQNLAMVAVVGFLIQGLAVMHAWAHAKQWHAALIAPVYVLLITPLLGVIVLALSAIGLMDNWFDLRAQLRARSGYGD